MLLTQSTRASTPAAGHLIFIMRIVCQQRGGREEAASSSSSGALFNGKGALLPSVAGADALQPCVGTRKERGGEK